MLTLLLVSFLVVLLLALTTLVRVETTAAGDQLAQARARAEARFALAVALGELQRHAGPDTRATATAGLLDANPASPAVDGVAHPHWTGVWATTPQRSNTGIDAGIAPAWLVSGQEGLAPGAAGTFGPRSGPPAGTTLVPLVRAAVEDPSFDPVGDAPTRPELHVSAPRVASVLAQPSAGEGAHAWWVGDEGVKASFTAVEPSDGSRFLVPAADRLLSPARTGLAGLPGWEAVDANDPALAARLARVETAGEAGVLLPAVAPRAREDFHDVGFGARSVLADPRRGGLKLDLSVAFSQDESDWRTGPLAGGASFSESVPGLAQGARTRVSYLFTEPTAAGRSFRGPTWDLLRNWHNLWRDISYQGGLPTLAARPHAPNTSELGKYSWNTTHLFNMTSVQGDPGTDVEVRKDNQSVPVPRILEPAVAAYISEVRLVFGLRSVPTVDPTSGRDAYRIEILFIPIVVIHNPTNVWLDLPESRLAFRAVPVTFQLSGSTFPVAGAPGDGPGPTQSLPQVDFEDLARSVSDRASWTDFLQFILPEIRQLAPGSFTVLSVPGPTSDFNSRVEARVGKFDDGGFVLPKLRLPPGSYPNGVRRGEAMREWLVPTNGTVQVRASPGFVQGVGSLPNEPSRETYALWIQHLLPRGGESASGSINEVAQLQELEVSLFEPPPPFPSSGSSAAQISAYQGSNPDQVSVSASILDASLNAPPTQLLSVGVVAKSANHAANRAVRPYLTGSPFAPSSRRFVQSGMGYPGILYPWQPEVKRPQSWFQVVESNGSRGYWGGSSLGPDTVVVQDVPQAPMISLGQFQSLPMAVHGAQPTYVIGHAFDHPLIRRDSVRELSTPVLADLSYLANESLFDRYFLSTLAARRGSQLPDSVAAFLAGSTPLNPRMRIAPELGLSPSELSDLLLDPRTGAAALMVEGGFNVNSTSVDAWAAVLGGARGLAVQATRPDGGNRSLGEEGGEGPHRFSRFSRPIGVERGRSVSRPETWSALVTLDDGQVRDLAEAIVEQVRRRGAGGPFGSLGSFLNRPLVAGADGSRGLLQAAIDASGVNASIQSDTLAASTQSSNQFGSFRRAANGLGPTGEAASGNLLQGDLVQALAPILATRSDTFLVRTYGEVRNPVTDEVEGRAWVEALVQRLPEPVRRGAVDPGDVPAWLEPDPAAPVDFGRRFRVIRFRWLAPDEV